MRLCVVYYILLYYAIHSGAVVSSGWLCDWNIYCSREEKVFLKNEVHLGPNYLKITCIAVMYQYSNMYWRIWNKDPRYFSEGVSACSKFTYYGREGRHECELEVGINKLRGHTFTCHAGELRGDLYKLPDTDYDWWNSSIFVQGASDSVAYTPSAVVEATCIVDVSDKLYPADYAAQWLLVNDPTELPSTTSDSWQNGTNFRTLEKTISKNFVTQLRVELNYAPSSDDDGKFLVCRCWHLKMLEGCGHKNVQLKLNSTKFGDAESSLERKSVSLTVWLSLVLVVAAMALLISLVIFLRIRFKTSKKAITQSKEELYTDIQKLYSVPIKKSQRVQNLPNDIPLQSIQSDEYDSPYSEENVYVYSEFEDSSNIYGNFPVLISSTLPRRDEPLYANT